MKYVKDVLPDDISSKNREYKDASTKNLKSYKLIENKENYEEEQESHMA